MDFTQFVPVTVFFALAAVAFWLLMKKAYKR